MQVEPFASLTEAVRSSVPRLLINWDLVGPWARCPRSKDVVQLGDLVHSVEKLVALLGWTEELKDLVQQETGKVQGFPLPDWDCLAEQWWLAQAGHLLPTVLSSLRCGQ